MKVNIIKLKLVKALIFIAIGIVFMYANFYIISWTNADGEGFMDITRQSLLEENWFELFKPTIISNILGTLFILLGIIEIKEAITDGN